MLFAIILQFSALTESIQVNATTKGLQTMATLCSCLKYFGKVVIGVARPEDKDIILDLVSYSFYCPSGLHLLKNNL
jgi:hypothetical protein